MKILTLENAAIGLQIRNINNPEWGVWTLSKDDNGWIKSGRSGSNHIWENDFKYWEVI